MFAGWWSLWGVGKTWGSTWRCNEPGKNQREAFWRKDRTQVGKGWVWLGVLHWCPVLAGRGRRYANLYSSHENNLRNYHVFIFITFFLLVYLFTFLLLGLCLDFDEQTADDWDVDMSVYYDKGTLNVFPITHNQTQTFLQNYSYHIFIQPFSDRWRWYGRQRLRTDEIWKEAERRSRM